ncbi:hypothetical protein GE107_15260 [Cohnella sp. CFH 77786]|uniref:hypothetical protein n=1 Tax=Cohnella sp. CFH 77786 TaxID=2662265 RepID=UPI001C60BD81|nr:hypothetical protein [Cohnella sp. CFH 77786]MBW5447415.1 hypothetical protein [Cohnella sp. CFH 77786]
MSAPGFEPRKLLGLVIHPDNSLKLEPKDDWLYGVVGAAMGTVGFAFWVWAVHFGFVRSLTVFADLIYTALVGSSPTGRFLWIGIVSIIALIAVLSIAGNRMGGRKRNWMEAVAHLGGAQAWFGAAFAVNGLVALALWKISMVLMLSLLLLNLVVLVSRAADLHEVGSARRFAYAGLSLVIYATAVAVVYAIF